MWFRGHPVQWSAIDLFLGFGIFAKLHIAENKDAHCKYPPVNDLTSFLTANHILFLLSLGCPFPGVGRLWAQSLRALAPLRHGGLQRVSPTLWLLGFFCKKVWEGVLCVLRSFGVRFWGATVRFWHVAGLSHYLAFEASWNRL